MTVYYLIFLFWFSLPNTLFSVENWKPMNFHQFWWTILTLTRLLWWIFGSVVSRSSVSLCWYSRPHALTIKWNHFVCLFVFTEMHSQGSLKTGYSTHIWTVNTVILSCIVIHAMHYAVLSQLETFMSALREKFTINFSFSVKEAKVLVWITTPAQTGHKHYRTNDISSLRRGEKKNKQTDNYVCHKKLR